VIAAQFVSRTILTIAHRINTIIENDKVGGCRLTVLDRGMLPRVWGGTRLAPWLPKETLQHV